VRSVLSEIGADHVPELVVFNKADLLTPEDKPRLDRLKQRHPGGVVLSARSGEGIDDLLTALADRLRALFRVVELVVPYDRGDVVAALHRHGEVLAEEHEADATRVRARLHEVDVPRFAAFVAS
ncbi:MAG: GTPase HflX, partial [Acidimicrobiales bacterium]